MNKSNSNLVPCRADCRAAVNGVHWRCGHLLCGGFIETALSMRLQRVERVRVEKKIDKADICDAVVRFHFCGKVYKNESGKCTRGIVALNAICKEAA